MTLVKTPFLKKMMRPRQIVIRPFVPVIFPIVPFSCPETRRVLRLPLTFLLTLLISRPDFSYPDLRLPVSGFLVPNGAVFS